MTFSSYGLQDIKFNGKDEFTVPSEEKYGVNYTVRTVSYTTQSHSSGVDLDCSCPAYRYYPDKDGVPGCKHTKRVLAEFKPKIKIDGFERK